MNPEEINRTELKQVIGLAAELMYRASIGEEFDRVWYMREFIASMINVTIHSEDPYVNDIGRLVLGAMTMLVNRGTYEWSTLKNMIDSIKMEDWYREDKEDSV